MRQSRSHRAEADTGCGDSAGSDADAVGCGEAQQPPLRALLQHETRPAGGGSVCGDGGAGFAAPGLSQVHRVREDLDGGRLIDAVALIP